MVEVGARSIGARVLRSEDPRILTGRGRYIDDLTLPGMLHAAFKRSVMPHGRIASIDVSVARALPGVVAVYTGADLAARTNAAAPGSAIGMNLMPGLVAPAVYALATDKVRYVGDPIAWVVAEDRYIAEDAIELIEEDIDWIDPIVTYDDALDPSKPKVFDDLEDNVAFRSSMAIGDVDGAFEQAERVVRTGIWVHRHQPVPMETRGLISTYDRDTEQVTIHSSTQSPHMIRVLLPGQINVPMEKIRVLADDVGGGFGLKNGVQRDEVAVIAASIDLARPVKWIEDRLEHLAVGTIPLPTKPRCARSSPGTCADAPATRASSKECSWQPSAAPVTSIRPAPEPLLRDGDVRRARAGGTLRGLGRSRPRSSRDVVSRGYRRACTTVVDAR
jgi:carbon-monoxide dehydrogenase large subunit